MFLDLFPDSAELPQRKRPARQPLHRTEDTEDTPVITETTAFRGGVVIAQVNGLVEPGALPRVDIPGDWVDVWWPPAALPARGAVHPEPALITEMQTSWRCSRSGGVYGSARGDRGEPRHRLQHRRHRAAPAHLRRAARAQGQALPGLRADPHPTLIPAIESGWVHSIMPFGGEGGIADYCAAHPEIFPLGPDGTMRSNRMGAQTAGSYRRRRCGR